MSNLKSTCKTTLFNHKILKINNSLKYAIYCKIEILKGSLILKNIKKFKITRLKSYWTYCDIISQKRKSSQE